MAASPPTIVADAFVLYLRIAVRPGVILYTQLTSIILCYLSLQWTLKFDTVFCQQIKMLLHIVTFLMYSVMRQLTKFHDVHFCLSDLRRKCTLCTAQENLAKKTREQSLP